MSKAGLFTGGAAYGQFRPRYPKALYDLVIAFTGRARPVFVADVGCGTGQVIEELVHRADHIVGIDGSRSQLDAAFQHPNVSYQIGTAESLPLPDESCDLLTVAQAAHWFDLEKFYSEAKRVLKPDGALAIWGYSVPELSDYPLTRPILHEYHTQVLGPYWDEKRQLVDSYYAHIGHLPFHHYGQIMTEMVCPMRFGEFTGYLGTSSALKTLRERCPDRPVDALVEVSEKLHAAITPPTAEDEPLNVRFRVFLFLGRGK